MNAAFSPRGHRFAAQYADIAFVAADDLSIAQLQAREIRSMARIAVLAAAGIDGLCLQWMNYDEGLPPFISDVLPLLQQLGVRRPRT
jgi:alkanesulfonate monooxygenase SsuD/methylene tetrahydromethanopterin reductase-like flavin-dependent oxidoreductase (luciferase family)